MKRTLYLIPLIIIISSCAKEPPLLTKTEPYKEKQKKPTESINVFDAPFTEVWSSTLQVLKWMKWDTAFVEIEDGTIRLKEAYVYTKSGKLFRNYRWPSKEEAEQSNIDNYVEKVTTYDQNVFDFDRPVFSQEIMTINVIKLSKSQTKVDVTYKINLYLTSGKLAHGVQSSGYMETLVFKQIRERLNGKPSS